ncbi:MAG: tetratricopeptide repeat protein, partial [Planctomycetota bacterium]|nr:tetratricopeptide repeat protein [Planctomycetota bacterium]
MIKIPNYSIVTCMALWGFECVIFASFTPLNDQKIDVSQVIQQAYQSSTRASTQKDHTATISLCDQGLAANPTENQTAYLSQLKSWALVARAKLYPLEKDFDPEQKNSPSLLAIQDCETALIQDSSNWKAHVHRAKRWTVVGNYKKATADLDAAIRKNPTDANLWFNRAELFYQQKDYEVAVTDYTEALKLNNNDVQSLTGRGHCYVQLKKTELAKLDYDEVIEKAPRNATAFLNRADLYLTLQEFKLAGQDYREALIRDQTLAQAYRGVAWMYATSGKDDYHNPTVADRSVKKAIELDGKETPENLVVLAAAQAAGGDYSMARDTLNRVKASNKLQPTCRER